MTREEIIELKEKRGYSVAKLSEYSGVPEGTIRKIITGESKNPRLATLNALEKVLKGDESRYVGKNYEYDEQSAFPGAMGGGDDPSFFDIMVCEEPVQYMAGNVAVKPAEGTGGTLDRMQKKQGEYTIDDYFALPDGDRKELIDGVFYDMATPLTVHQDIVGYMYLEIGNFIRKNKGKCKVFVAPSAVRLDCDKKTMVEPDIYVVCDKDKIKRFGNYGAPDFILEVLSDSTRKKDLGVKVYKYINAGVREIWYIDVKTRKLLTYYEGDDYMPTVYPLEGMLGLAIYDDKLQINLSEIGDIIEEYSTITDPD